MRPKEHENESKLEGWLRTLSTWQLLKLTLALGFVAGALFGLAAGTFYTQERIVNALNDTAWQERNYVELRANTLYEIAPVSVACGIDREAWCQVVNLHDRTLRYYFPANDTFTRGELSDRLGLHVDT